MEEDLMIPTNRAADEEVEELPIQVLFLMNRVRIVSQIDEVLADIGQPDCKLINPCVIDKDGKLTKWLSDLTDNTEMFLSSDKILTLVDPNQKILDDYVNIIQ
tara:strand:+ start:72 stop:380 length:309 start_codon:yes stop_codon:yes gene_type:complete